jgi:formylglycine-generating enzyme required for sulfatase activity
MSLRSDARYETVADFARALERPAGRPSAYSADMPRRTEPLPMAPPARSLPAGRQLQMQRRTMWALLVLLVLIVGAGTGIALLGPNPLFGGEEAAAAATATTQSQVIAALTAVAPTVTPTPDPTALPTATPAPFITETGSRMVYIPGGLFRLGSEDGEADEQPSKMVRLDPYYLDETEVTNRAYAQCVAAEVCKPPARNSAAFRTSYYDSGEFSDYPVIYVNWHQARQFCEWRGARLPSEAEWEMAAGFDPEQGIKSQYPWGDQFDGTLLNYCESNCYNGEKQDPNYDDGYGDTAPVGTYPEGRSALGAYDMLGNVMEWTNDWYDRAYYSYAPESNPLGPAEGFAKSVRGGSWLSSREELGVSTRTFYDPNEVRTNIGFRCAMPVP